MNMFGKSRNTGGNIGRADRGARDADGNKIGGQFTPAALNNVHYLARRQQSFPDPYNNSDGLLTPHVTLDPKLKKKGGQKLADWLIDVTSSHSHLEHGEVLVMSGLNLSGANMEGAQISNVVLTRANLMGAQMRGVQLTNVDISHSRLTGADLRYATFVQCQFNHVDARRKRVWRRGELVTDFTGSCFTETTCHAMDARGVSLDGIMVQGNSSDWTDADVRGATLNRANIYAGSWVGARTDYLHTVQAVWNIPSHRQPSFPTGDDPGGDVVPFRRPA